jgi:hypothetical protein
MRRYASSSTKVKGAAQFSECNKPSSLFGQFEDEQVNVVAGGVDDALECRSGKQRNSRLDRRLGQAVTT